MGYKIKELRNEKRMSQEELAERSGVSRQTISAIENGGTDVTTKTLAKIAMALGTTVAALFFDNTV